MIIEAFAVKVKEGMEKEFGDVASKMLEALKTIDGLTHQMLLKRRGFKRNYIVISRWRSFDDLEKFRSYSSEKIGGIITKFQSCIVKQSKPRRYHIVSEA